MDGKRQRGTAKRGERDEGGVERGGEEGEREGGGERVNIVMAVLYWQPSSTGTPVLAFLTSPILAIVYWQSCPGISDPHAIIFMSGFASPI
jgi:hypothetical protein